jgi:ribonuclease HII
MTESLLLHTPERSRGGSIAGIDEVGRGCVAGPVVAACVVFSWDSFSELEALDRRVRIRDSKLMTRAQRTLGAELIREHALFVGVGLVEADVIDEINILQATFEAMRLAQKAAGCPPDTFYFIDGNKTVPEVSWRQKAVVDGDAQIFSIAAASIIAKEYRDSLMERLHEQYPSYFFAKHKGYGTKEHYAAIQAHGILPVHRKTFLKRFLTEV